MSDIIAANVGVQGVRLDASESVFFRRQLEVIAPRAYDTVYPEFVGRQVVPTIGGLPEWTKVFLYRGYTMFGSAKVIGDYADDLPRADVAGNEVAQLVKTIGASFGYSREEMQLAMATGTPLSEMKAKAARRAIEGLIDVILSTGDAQNGLGGILNVTGATTETAGTKTGGGTAWTLAGVADEIAFDVLSLVAKIVLDTKMSFQRFNITLPIAKYNLLAQKRMGDGSNMTILAYLLATSPYIESIKPWYRTDAAGASAGTRMAAIPTGEGAVGAIVPQEFRMEIPQDRNLESVVLCTARVGGVVAFQPKSVGYMDAI